MKMTLVDERQIGPVSEQELKQLALGGKIKKTTLVCSPTRTKQKWCAAGQISGVNKLIEQGEQQRREAAEAKRAQHAQELAAADEREERHRQQLQREREIQNAPRLRRCIAQPHFQFSSALRCQYCEVETVPFFSIEMLNERETIKSFSNLFGVLARKNSEPLVALSLEEEQSLFSEILCPFLSRNEANANPAIRVSGIKIESLRSLGETATAIVPESEISLLRETIQLRYGFDIFQFAAPVKVLVATALKRDFQIFSRQIMSFAHSNSCSVVEAFVELKCDEVVLFMFLQQLQHSLGDVVDEDVLRQLVGQKRRDLNVKKFQSDLENRKSERLVVTIEMVDQMNPFSFELLLGMIYQAKGYLVIETPKSGDQGADVLVERAGYKSVIQAKLYSAKVGNKAVQEAIAAHSFFDCHKALVITNNFFTRSAIQLASTCGVTLINRVELIELLAEFNRSPKDYSKLKNLFR